MKIKDGQTTKDRKYTVIQKRPPNTLSYSTVISQRFLPKVYECLRKLGAVYSNLIPVPPAADVRTLLHNVDVNKITLLRTVHMIQLKC